MAVHQNERQERKSREEYFALVALTSLNVDFPVAEVYQNTSFMDGEE